MFGNVSTRGWSKVTPTYFFDYRNFSKNQSSLEKERLTKYEVSCPHLIEN